MKTLATIVVAALLGVAGACAHEKHEHAAGPGLFGQPPEYLHVLFAHPSQKPVVERGVARINHALEELKQSAETGSEFVMKNNFKEFKNALNEFEQQTKKQL